MISVKRVHKDVLEVVGANIVKRLSEPNLVMFYPFGEIRNSLGLIHSKCLAN